MMGVLKFCGLVNEYGDVRITAIMLINYVILIVIGGVLLILWTENKTPAVRDTRKR